MRRKRGRRCCWPLAIPGNVAANAAGVAAGAGPAMNAALLAGDGDDARQR